MDITLRKSNEDDKEYLRALHKRCYFDVVSRQFGQWDDEVQARFFEMNWNPEKFQIVVRNGVNIGALAYEVKADHMFLTEIQIDTLYQRKGFGTHLIKLVVNESKAKDLPLLLKVLKQNHKAAELYRRLGFRQISETDTHIMMEFKH
jgi:ribosomal protein S18 acetylase RimI-like enzyme